jgi:LysR family glycine cleavage system transcriptional activator
MRRHLPPLNPLKAFEAAARHLSLTQAANELHVTQVAISRQVRLLEENLGVQLFHRGHRSISLTPQGIQLQNGITHAFDEIETVTKAISVRGRRDILSIQAYTTFAQRWLIPLLSRFHQDFPNIEVRLTASLNPVDFERQNIDAAIRSGMPKDWPTLSADFVAPLELMPVISPRLLENSPPLSSPADLSKHTLLHSIARSEDWTSWLQASGAHALNGHGGIKFENSAMAYEAAIQGMGVAIGIRVLVTQYLASGALVTPFKDSVRLPTGYYLVRPNNRPESQALRVFRQYLMEDLQRAGAI